ncbi:hypothetical protein INT47_002258 [Mucor saturninus]|uniref:BAG domain-containing protein n=1 Tax=Mucor saturninus TaxID=64648 RepID=A0A8H7QX19_9FUNG|nr:hypothetical protein INT47_002258 [Mucor saturninus]
MALANERIITLDDFSQLQALLDYEQQERDKHIMQCHHNRPPMAPSLHKRRHQQFRRAINPQASLQSSLERARLAEASMRLKRMRTQYKRRRTLEVQIYLDNYRRQALVRAVLPEEEELYYRQCIAAALEARRVQACLQEYVDIKRLQDMQNQIETQLFLANQEPVVEDDTEGYDAYRTLQLETLLRHLFNQQTQEDIELTPKSELEEAEDMAEVWKLLSNQKTNYETPRSAFLAPDHDVLLGMDKNIPDVGHNQNKQEGLLDEKFEIVNPIDQVFTRQEQVEAKKAKDQPSSKCEIGNDKSIESAPPKCEDELEKLLKQVLTKGDAKAEEPIFFEKPHDELKTPKKHATFETEFKKIDEPNYQIFSQDKGESDEPKEQVPAKVPLPVKNEAKRNESEKQKDHTPKEYVKEAKEIHKHKEHHKETKKHKHPKKAEKNEIKSNSNEVIGNHPEEPNRKKEEKRKYAHETNEKKEQVNEQKKEVNEKKEEANEKKEEANEKKEEVNEKKEETDEQKEGYVHNEPKGDNKAEETMHSNEEADDKNFDYDIDFPPLQKHVVPLQDLIQRLASEPVLIGEQQTHFSDEPKPSGIWAKKSHAKSPPPPPLSTQREDKKATFLPQHIFTEAEPTPTLENMPNTPLGQEEEGEESQHFVNSVAAEQKNEIVPPDPKKTKMLEELESIKHQLQDDDSELVKRWKHVLQGGDDGSQHLEFSKQQQGTLVLTATTGFNRQFLGSEDELVRTLIRLDAIDSMGDECIRKKRKSLVKTCESMLDKLDAYKQTQWEKAIVK